MVSDSSIKSLHVLQENLSGVTQREVFDAISAIELTEGMSLGQKSFVQPGDGKAEPT
jgi:hypothetical protein